MAEQVELRAGRWSLAWLIILLLGASVAAGPSILRIPLQARNQERGTLTAGKPVARELSSGATHSYRVTLDAGQYLRVEVIEQGIDVALTLAGAAGEQLAESRKLIGSVEWVSVIADAGGAIQIEVRPTNPSSAGAYEVKIAELHTATVQDQVRVRADRAFEAAQHFYSQRTAEAYRNAAEKCKEAAALYKGVDDPQGEAFALYVLGLSYRRLNDRARSLESFQQAVPLLRNVEERRAEAWTLVEIGSLHHEAGKEEQAIEAYSQALPLLRKVGDQSREGYALSSIGLVYSSIGDRLQAITYHERALAIRRRFGDRRGEASSLTALGGDYDALGEKQKAVEYLHQALPLLHAIGERSGEAQVLQALGATYDSLNERQKAVDYFNRALSIRRATADLEHDAAVNQSIGNIYQGLRDYEQALLHYKRALSLYEGQKDYRRVARILRNMGLVYDEIGEKQKAADHYRRALPLFRLGSDRQSLARLLANLGKVCSESGQHEQALAHLNEALPLLQKLNNQFFEVYALYWIARSERERGNLREARAKIEAALSKIEKLRSRFYQPDLRTAGFTRAQDFYELEIDLLMRLAESQPDKNAQDKDEIHTALEVSEQARARTMLDLLAEAKIDIRQGISSELKRRELASQARLSAVQSQLIEVQQQPRPDARRITALEAELKKADEEREELELEIRARHPRYAEILYPTPLRAEAIRELLDERTALLEYTLGKERSFLFVVTQEGVRTFRLPKADEIARLVQELRGGLTLPGRREFASYRRAAGQLYQTLVAPAAETLVSKQTLLIAADGALHYLPFEALLADGADANQTAGAADLDYLVKRWAISYVPSASVLASLRRGERGAADKGAMRFVAFADPVYRRGEQNGAPDKAAANAVRSFDESESRWDLTRLTQSRREVTEIARLYNSGEVALYFGTDAKEENVKGNAALANARRIHFATHGVLREGQPAYSGLILTLDNDPKEDGLLQVYEIFNLKLNAELVVLSACQTGLGQELRGEGIIGLTRSFMYAGAPSVVASLWRVADRSTAELMVKFYRQLELAGGKAEALRRAKLELMREPRFAHPYYWATFVLVGEPR